MSKHIWVKCNKCGNIWFHISKIRGLYKDIPVVDLPNITDNPDECDNCHSVNDYSEVRKNEK